MNLVDRIRSAEIRAISRSGAMTLIENGDSRSSEILIGERIVDAGKNVGVNAKTSGTSLCIESPAFSTVPPEREDDCRFVNRRWI